MNKTVKVAVLGFAGIQEYALELAFSRIAKERYHVESESAADIFLIDVDSFNGATLLADTSAAYPNKPVIVFSIEPREDATCLNIRKPFQSAELFDCLREAEEQLDRASAKVFFRTDVSPAKTPVEKPAGTVGLPEAKPFGANAAATAAPTSRLSGPTLVVVKTGPTAAEPGKPSRAARPDGESARASSQNTDEQSETPQRQSPPLRAARDDRPDRLNLWKVSFSTPDVDLSDSRMLASIQYEPARFFQSRLTEIFAEAKNRRLCARVRSAHGWMAYVPRTDKIVMKMKDSRLFAVSSVPGMRSHFSVDYVKESEIDDTDCTLIGSEQLLWKTAIWASRGRVPVGISLDKEVTLLEWPNLTRLALFPHAVSIAALWSQHPLSLLETIDALRVPQKFVFLFFSAAHALGAVEIGGQQEVQEKRRRFGRRNRSDSMLHLILRALRFSA